MGLCCLLPLLLLLSVPSAAAQSAPFTFSCFASAVSSPSSSQRDFSTAASQTLQLLPDVAAAGWSTVGVEAMFQSLVTLPAAVQTTAVVIIAGNNSGFLLLRAALYTAASFLIAQTAVYNFSTETEAKTGSALLLSFPAPLNLTRGSYLVAYWFAAASNDGRRYVEVAAVNNATSSFSFPLRQFQQSEGALPAFLGTGYTYGDGLHAAFVQLAGRRWEHDPTPARIDLNATVSRILHAVRDKHETLPAIGAAVIQTPTAGSYTGASSPVDALCPFIPVATAVAGVRRSDAVRAEPVTVDDEWHLGSDTKSMTAVMIDMLIASGNLSLTTTVQQIFPYLPLFPQQPQTTPGCSCSASLPAATSGYFSQSNYSCNLVLDRSWENVTIAHLLTHASGLQGVDSLFESGSPIQLEEYRLDAVGGNESCTGYPVPSRRYRMQQLLSLRLPVPPASPTSPVAYAYSNNNFILLGFVLEELWRRPWEQIVRQQLFEPLGMTTAGFGPPELQVPLELPAVQPFGHYADNRAVLHSTDDDNPQSLTPAGRVHVSLGDWSRFIACHLQEGRNVSALGYRPRLNSSSFLNAERYPHLLPASAWRAVHLPYTFPGSAAPNSDYTLSGMGASTGLMSLQLTHDGSNTLWYCEVTAYPRLSQPVAVMVVANVANAAAVVEAQGAIKHAYVAWLLQGQPATVQQPAAAAVES